VEVSCRRMSLFLKDTHESHDSLSVHCEQRVQLCAAAYGKHTARRRTRPIVLAARGTAPRPPPVATAVAH
jgi:hypothetical protein